MLSTIILFVSVAQVCANDNSLYFNRNVQETETFLNEEDFIRAKNIPQSRFASKTASKAEWNSGKYEGDMAGITAADFQRSPHNRNAMTATHRMWTPSRVPYAISSTYSSYSRSIIAAAMQDYATKSCIRFVPKTDSDTHYLSIKDDGGCYSYVGKIFPGGQTLSLGDGCLEKGIIIHELLHALGFFHEQSRDDRDNFVTINMENIVEGME